MGRYSGNGPAADGAPKVDLGVRVADGRLFELSDHIRFSFERVPEAR